jgi:hypothetical protein
VPLDGGHLPGGSSSCGKPKRGLNLQLDIIDYPLGIRLWPSELRSSRQRIREGYCVAPLENAAGSFRFTALAGAEKIAAIFRSFAACLPEEAFLILEFYEEPAPLESEEQPVPTVYYSPYLPREEILSVLEPYLPRLIHDGFVGFGLANNRAGLELFYSEEKVLTCFAGNHIRIMDMLGRHGLRHDPQMLFPTDLGHDHLSLLCHPPAALPQPFAVMNERELDYVQFCSELTELLDMYQVEESLSFFLSEREQDAIEACLAAQEQFAEFAEEDFGSLLLDWNDFVAECEAGFEGDLWEYRQGLKLRDMIQHVAESVPKALSEKILEIVADADSRLRKDLIDVRKRLDPPAELRVRADHFWYRGIVRNQGVYLRRDLIRQGWYKP